MTFFVLKFDNFSNQNSLSFKEYLYNVICVVKHVEIFVPDDFCIKYFWFALFFFIEL